ncbi:hypothetical protein [Paenarthrobacter aromaticivorans]|uniref:hypothetical protein n=1 Tax=Paenarthrobacter aromaticivorans TaxID=2849150 RepID=UPI003A813E05
MDGDAVNQALNSGDVHELLKVWEAYDFYRRGIEELETYLPDLHNAVSARAVLED